MKSMILVLVIMLGTVTAHGFADNCAPVRPMELCSGEKACFDKALRGYEAHRRSLMGCVRQQALPRIYRAVEGRAAKSIVLVHGLADSPQAMDSLARSYQSRGYNVVSVNLTGHGGSNSYLQKKADSESWRKDVSYAYSIAKHLGKDVEGFGHSTGGAILMNVATKKMGAANFSKLTVMDPAINFDGKHGGVIKHGACLANNFGLKYADQVESIVTESWFSPVRGYYKEARANLPDKLWQPPACEQKTATMEFNDRKPTSALCALTKIGQPLTAARLRKLPPTEVVLSNDPLYNKLVNNKKIESLMRKASPKTSNVRWVYNIRHASLIHPECSNQQSVRKALGDESWGTQSPANLKMEIDHEVEE